MLESSPDIRNAHAVWAKQKARLPVFVGVLLCLAAIYFFNLEEDLQLFRLFLVFIAGFFVSGLLAGERRLKFIWALNAGAVFALFGATAGLGILVMGLSFFLIVNLPVGVWWRALLALLLGGVLAMGKLGYLPFAEAGIVSTVIGGLFMFRSILYLYEVHHGWQGASIWLRLNYFFLLPNLIFVIFPVVDLKTFVRTYQPEILPETLEKGLLWMMRGMFHLLLYRIAYYYLMPDPAATNSVFQVIQYMAVSYALIVRLSGIFHLSTGMLCLFGFNLPPTFDNYFLATGFSDLWRRINVYWKDFMMKVFYFPIYFRFAKRNSMAVFISVMLVFLINWGLHQYQWFWIKGTFPITIIDAMFWLGFGLLVAANSIYQIKNKKKRKKVKEFSLRAASVTCLQVIGMFTFMSVLWSFWTSPSIGTWLELIELALPVSAVQLALIAGGLVALYCIGIAGSYVSYYLDKTNKNPDQSLKVKAYSLFWVVAVVLMVNPVSKWVETTLAIDLGPVREARLNAADAARQFQGYYETLLTGKDLATVGVAKDDNGEGDNWQPLGSFGIIEETGNEFSRRLVPNVDIIFKDAQFTTNSFGLRDREYTPERPPNTLRIALLGGSSEMGAGVSDEETFENLVEDTLNQGGGLANLARVEILNFALSGMKMPNQVMKAAEALTYDPQVLVYAIHTEETGRGLREFIKVFTSKDSLSFPEIQEISKRAGLEPEMSSKRKQGLLRPYVRELATWVAHQVGELALKQNVAPVMMFAPVLSLHDPRMLIEDEEIKDIFRAAGFLVVDVQDAYQGYDVKELRVAKTDNHPNALAHRLMAAEVLRQLQYNDELISLLGTIEE